MNLSNDRVVGALLCSASLLDEKTIFGGDRNKVPISVSAIHKVVAARSGYQIELEEVSFEASHIFGQLKRFDGKIAKVRVRSDLPDFVKRLVAVKEIVHLVLDDESEFCPYGDEILDELMLSGQIGVLSSVGSPHQSEALAELTAMEVLYPLALRLEDVPRLRRRETSFGKLSLKYEIPEPFIQTLMNPKYLDFIGKALEAATSNKNST